MNQLLLALLLAYAGGGAAFEVGEFVAQQLVHKVLGFAGAVAHPLVEVAMQR